MAASGAIPGLFFCAVATVLLILVSISAPTWNAISFLNANGISFGVFGYTGSQVHVGYYFPTSLPDSSSSTLHDLTYALILYPIAAGLAGISVLFGLCGAGYHRSGTVFMSLTAALALLCTLIVWIISTSLFGVERERLQDNGVSASWGNATWLGLGALISLLVGFCTAACGVFGSYRRTRRF